MDLHAPHDHVFLGNDHATNERRTWVVIGLCTVMMIAEIVGGALFGSIALIADGLHMSTHAAALLIAALAYTYARRHASDRRFTFGTGKLGDLAGFTSAVILAMISVLIAYEAGLRMIHPGPIEFDQAIPIAVLGLIVNIVSAWLLSGGGGHSHGHSHGHQHGHGDQHDESRRIDTPQGALVLEVFEDNVPPRFRLRSDGAPMPAQVQIETLRPDGARQVFAMQDRGGYLESVAEIPEPHAFTAQLTLDQAPAIPLLFEEHAHGAHHADNNMRAALIHVVADAAVSVLVIIGLLAARSFGWLWMDPLVGLVGAGVIASWAYGLVRDTGAILLDMAPDRAMADSVQRMVEAEGDHVADLHVWRLGPGHLGAIVSILTDSDRGSAFYHARLQRFPALSHITVEVRQPGWASASADAATAMTQGLPGSSVPASG